MKFTCAFAFSNLLIFTHSSSFTTWTRLIASRSWNLLLYIFSLEWPLCLFFSCLSYLMVKKSLLYWTKQKFLWNFWPAVYTSRILTYKTFNRNERAFVLFPLCYFSGLVHCFPVMLVYFSAYLLPFANYRVLVPDLHGLSQD